MKDSIGNITYQKEIEKWTGRKNELQRNIVDFENTFLANYEKKINPLLRPTKSGQNRSLYSKMPEIMEASGVILKENQAQTGLRSGIMIRIGKVVLAVSVPKEHQALMSVQSGKVKIFG